MWPSADLEKRMRHYASNWSSIQSQADIGRLLARIRELEAALSPFADSANDPDSDGACRHARKVLDREGT